MSSFPIPGCFAWLNYILLDTLMKLYLVTFSGHWLPYLLTITWSFQSLALISYLSEIKPAFLKVFLSLYWCKISKKKTIFPHQKFRGCLVQVILLIPGLEISLTNLKPLIKFISQCQFRSAWKAFLRWSYREFLENFTIQWEGNVIWAY